MKYLLTCIFILLSLFASIGLTQGSANSISSMNIQCDSFYKCLSESEIKSLVGKTLRYRHPGGAQFGTVTIKLKSDGTAYGENLKGVAGNGPWEIKDGSLIIKFSRWGDSLFRFIRIDPSVQIFFFVDSNNRALLIPIEVTD